VRAINRPKVCRYEQTSPNREGNSPNHDDATILRFLLDPAIGPRCPSPPDLYRAGQFPVFDARAKIRRFFKYLCGEIIITEGARLRDVHRTISDTSKFARSSFPRWYCCERQMILRSDFSSLSAFKALKRGKFGRTCPSFPIIFPDELRTAFGRFSGNLSRQLQFVALRC